MHDCNGISNKGRFEPKHVDIPLVAIASIRLRSMTSVAKWGTIALVRAPYEATGPVNFPPAKSAHDNFPSDSSMRNNSPGGFIIIRGYAPMNVIEASPVFQLLTAALARIIGGTPSIEFPDVMAIGARLAMAMNSVRPGSFLASSVPCAQRRSSQRLQRPWRGYGGRSLLRSRIGRWLR
jgi:hypothetical protein